MSLRREIQGMSGISMTYLRVEPLLSATSVVSVHFSALKSEYGPTPFVGPDTDISLKWRVQAKPCNEATSGLKLVDQRVYAVLKIRRIHERCRSTFPTKTYYNTRRSY